MAKTTKEKALIEGRALLQQHGYHGFSFQDIADKLNIKKPSLYDHFASKDELIVAIIQDYKAGFSMWTLSLQAVDPIDRIGKVFGIFYSFSSDRSKVCPILALAADFQGIARNIQKEMKAFVDQWLAWLEEQIREGQKAGQIRMDIEAKLLANFIYSQGMGSQFHARIKNDPSLTLGAGDQIVAFIKSPGWVV